MKKEAAVPVTGTFYIVEGKIAFTVDADDEHSIDHQELWPHVAAKAFPKLDFETKMELREAPYGTDRGRVVFLGQRNIKGKPQSGSFMIYGTKGCAPFEKQIMKAFGFINVPEQFNVKVDFGTDPHYRIQKHDAEIYNYAVKMHKEVSLQPMVQIAGRKRARLTPKIHWEAL